MLKDEEKRDNLRSKNIKGNFLDKFLNGFIIVCYLGIAI